MRILPILLSILILSPNINADILGATLVHQGDKMPYDGVLLTVPKAQQLYLNLQQCDNQKQVNISLLKSLSLMQDNEIIYKSEISELTTQNEKLDTALTKSNANSFWNKAMWLGIGVLSTGLIVYAARR